MWVHMRYRQLANPLVALDYPKSRHHLSRPEVESTVQATKEVVRRGNRSLCAVDTLEVAMDIGIELD